LFTPILMRICPEAVLNVLRNTRPMAHFEVFI
jgi:hypothetical protein